MLPDTKLDIQCKIKPTHRPLYTNAIPKQQATVYPWKSPEPAECIRILSCRKSSAFHGAVSRATMKLLPFVTREIKELRPRVSQTEREAVRSAAPRGAGGERATLGKRETERGRGQEEGAEDERKKG